MRRGESSKTSLRQRGENETHRELMHGIRFTKSVCPEAWEWGAQLNGNPKENLRVLLQNFKSLFLI